LTVDLSRFAEPVKPIFCSTSYDDQAVITPSVEPKAPNIAVLIALKFEYTYLFLPSSLLIMVSVNFCMGFVMNFVAIEDDGSTLSSTEGNRVVCHELDAGRKG